MEPKSDWFCSLSENNAACIYDDRHFRELRTSDGSHEESSLIDVAIENIELSGGTICTLHGTEVPLEFGRSVEIKIENMDESLQKNDVLSYSRKNLRLEQQVDEPCHVLYPHGHSSLTDVDVSGDCIKLFVDVFGPLNGLPDGSDSMIDEIETVPPDVKNGISESGVSSVAREDRLKVFSRQKRNHNAAAAAAADAADAELPLDSRTSSSGKDSESRERKKSKYISYPYVDVKEKAAPGTGQETEELIKATPLGISSGKSSWTHSTENPLGGVVSRADNIDASSSELLDNLRRIAYGWSHLSGSKHSDSLKRFYLSFRIFSFANDIISNDDGPLLTSLPQNNIKTEGVDVVKESENDKGSIASLSCNADCGVTQELLETENLVAEVRQEDKKKETDISVRDKVAVDPPSSTQDSCTDVPNLQFVSPNVNCGSQINLGSVRTMEDVGLALRSISPSQNINIATGYSDMKMAEFGSFFQQSVNAVRSEQLKRKRKMEKASEVASCIPDLNGTASDKTTSDLPDQQHDKKKRASSDPGGSLLLSFAPGCTLPPRETLSATFSRFGSLKESGIQILDESTVQIPYERSTEARFAFQSLEKRKLFGEALASFKLLCEAPAPKPKKRRTFQVQQHFMPVNLAAKPGEAPGLAFMKQNVEMMKSTLEKAGASISGEMRTKLENEIKVFLDRISSMADPSS